MEPNASAFIASYSSILTQPNPTDGPPPLVLVLLQVLLLVPFASALASALASATYGPPPLELASALDVLPFLTLPPPPPPRTFMLIANICFTRPTFAGRCIFPGCQLYNFSSAATLQAAICKHYNPRGTSLACAQNPLQSLN